MNTHNVNLMRVNYVFAAAFIAVIGFFIYWGLGYTNQNHILLFVLASVFGIFMAFNIGGNDVANSFGTSVGAGTLTIPQALAVAAVFEVSGAVIAGGEVTKTIRQGIVDLSSINVEPKQFIFIMMSALLAAALWLLFATKKGWPVSTTHSIIGGIVGSSICLGLLVSSTENSLALVKWSKIGEIAISWVLSPVLGGVMAYILFGQIKKYVLDYNSKVEKQLAILQSEKDEYKKEQKIKYDRLNGEERIDVASAMVRDMQLLSDSDTKVKADNFESEYYRGLYKIEERRSNIDTYRALQQWVPIISAVGGMMISSMLLFKGLKNLKLELSTLHNFLIIGMIGALIWMATFIYAKTLKHKDLAKSTFLMFSWMQVFTAAGFAFSHGANDIANAIGPFAAIMDTIRLGTIVDESPIPSVVMITFGIALITGLWFIGKEVIQTVGHNLTKMHPSSGFAAELSAATVVMLASLMGLPVSSTHILVGAVLGVGLVNRNANWSLMKPIGTAWVVTLPSAALLAVVIFLALRVVF
ncbi:inorganic phosphate transporter [Muribacter muris]|nr:inorganic phosphate transporter [Muribacter muris]